MTAHIDGFIKNMHYSIELERAVLGICLLEKPPLSGVLSILKPEMVYVPGHQAVYMVIREMRSKNLPIDILTVADYILNTRKINKISGMEVGWFLTTLTKDVVSSAHVNYHCAVLAQMYQRRLDKAAEVEGRPLVKVVQTTKPRHFPFKIAKYLLGVIDKGIIKQNHATYGNSIIRGKDKYCIKVENANQVFMMSLIAPEYTWSCVQGDEVWDRLKVRQSIPANCILKSYNDGSRYWEDKSGYPSNWN